MKASIIIPAKNEAVGLCGLLPGLRSILPKVEVLVIDDGSTDTTRQICESHSVQCISHPYSKGNGAAIKTGARAATGDILVFIDADGQHDPADIVGLLQALDTGFDMVVGARASNSQAGLRRLVGNKLYNRIASWIVGHPIADLTSGLRAVRAAKFREFLYLLPNGFSYPTTITMAFYRVGYSVGYFPIKALPRKGASHIRLLKDGAKFFLIIFKIGTLYSPIKTFLPISLSLGGMGLAYYLYTFLTEGRLTNISTMLFMTAIIVFVISLVSEQITMLIYQRRDSDRE